MVSILLNSSFFSLLYLFVQPNYSPVVAPKVVVEWLTPREHDFSVIPHDKPVETIFKFKNVAGESILLETVRTTCGCTAANWTEGAIAPGATGEVRIEYDAYQRGDFSTKIRVFFNKQRKAEILRIQGTVD